MTFTIEQIKEIAEQLDIGFGCFIHQQTKEIIFIPDPMKFPEMEMDAWETEIEKVENDPLDFFSIEPLRSNDSFRIMRDFVESFPDSNKFKDRLIYALNRPKPFRNFKHEIDYSDEYRQKWFDFKNQWMINWVRRELERFDDEFIP